jgi:hypothetical protein
MSTKNISRTSKVRSAFPPGPSFTNHNQSTLKVHKGITNNHSQTSLKVHKGLGANHNETALQIWK